MKKTFTAIWTPKIGGLASRKLFIFLIALSAIGCAGAPKFPTKTVYEVDRDLGACGVYTIVDDIEVKLDFVKDLPIDQCPPVFGFTAGDMPKVLDWVSDRIEESRKRK